MNIENSIKDVISKKLEGGIVEELVAKELENGITNALGNLFRSYGDVTKVIEKKVKSVMIPYLENYDYSDYIVKLDSVLVDVLKSSALENKKLLEGFHELMIPVDDKDLKVTDVYEKWMDYVSKNVSTDDLEIDYDDEPTYSYVDVSLVVEHNEERSWLKSERAIIIFECEHDEEMNVAIPIHRYTDISEKWTIDYKTAKDLDSLRHLNDFEIYLMKLDQNYTRLTIDTEYENDEVMPEERPEASFY